MSTPNKITEGSTEVQKYRFISNTDLEECVVPEGITRISKSAFANCQNLKKAVLPKGEFVHQKAFEQDVVVEYK